jgi:hypothetical protein
MCIGGRIAPISELVCGWTKVLACVPGFAFAEVLLPRYVDDGLPTLLAGSVGPHENASALARAFLPVASWKQLPIRTMLTPRVLSSQFASQ